MDIINLKLLEPFIIALFLGAVLGFGRTFTTKLDHEVEDFLGGIRTYSMVSLFGSIVSFLSEKYYPELLPLSFAGMVVLMAVSYYIGFSRHNEGGITTEMSLLICFIIGVIVQKNHLVLALFTAIITAGILHAKEFLRKFTDRVEPEDIRAALKFAIITFIILIVNPDYTFVLKDIGALGTRLFSWMPELADVKVVNPYNVWLMVVLISGIGFTGYIAMKILGSRKGIGLTGFLGGLVSSTATTATFAKRSREDEGAVGHLPYVLAVLLACSTMFPRIIVEVLVINELLVDKLIIIMGIMASAGFIFCFFVWKKSGKEKSPGDKSEEVTHRNPFNIMPALKFGLIFAAIVFIARIAEVLVGDSGIYLISVLTGLSDVDPITLTMSQISRDDPSKLAQATVAITLAAFANTLLKAGLAWFLGSKKFRRTILLGFGVIITAGVLGLFLVRII